MSYRWKIEWWLVKFVKLTGVKTIWIMTSSLRGYPTDGPRGRRWSYSILQTPPCWMAYVFARSPSLMHKWQKARYYQAAQQFRQAQQGKQFYQVWRLIQQIIGLKLVQQRCIFFPKVHFSCANCLWNRLNSNLYEWLNEYTLQHFLSYQTDSNFLGSPIFS